MKSWNMFSKLILLCISIPTTGHIDQNVEQEKDAEFVAMEKVAEEQSLEIPIVEQLLDEADKLNKAF
ncbi:hypothetical protein Tco_1206588 [Tanacetum coccineum]